MAISQSQNYFTDAQVLLNPKKTQMISIPRKIGGERQIAQQLVRNLSLKALGLKEKSDKPFP